MPVRRIEKRDITQILSWLPQLHGASFNWDEERLESELSYAETWVLEEEVKIQAFVCERLLPEAIEWTALATAPDRQKKGCMQTLLNERLTCLRAAKESPRQVWLEVHENNAGALKLYRNLGFVQTGSRAKYYRDGGTALLFLKNI
jgi:ribosomal-protein-alanine N-acetyltransferase